MIRLVHHIEITGLACPVKNLNRSSLNACMYMAGGGTSAAAECTSADEETISLDSRRLEVPCQFFGNILIYLVHNGYEVSDLVLIENNMCNRTQTLHSLMSSLATL